jgi:hypothetical protein
VTIDTRSTVTEETPTPPSHLADGRHKARGPAIRRVERHNAAVGQPAFLVQDTARAGGTGVGRTPVERIKNVFCCRNESRSIEKPKLRASSTHVYEQALEDNTGRGSWGQPIFLVVPMLKMSTPAPATINGKQNCVVLAGIALFWARGADKPHDEVSAPLHRELPVSAGLVMVPGMSQS